MQRVSFIAPTSDSDLRVVLSNASVTANADYAVVYKTQYGEVRTIPYLTAAEAERRAVALRRRGYRVVSGLMD